MFRGFFKRKVEWSTVLGFWNFVKSFETITKQNQKICKSIYWYIRDHFICYYQKTQNILVCLWKIRKLCNKLIWNIKKKHNNMFGVIRFWKTFFHSSPLYDCNLKRFKFLLPLHFVNLKILQHIKGFPSWKGNWFENGINKVE